MDDVAQVRERTDIIKLLSEYITVKKAGRNFKANCPFHNENTPSFMISPDRGMWHCFGCGKGGDAFTFLMEYEHMEFPEALRFLAKRAGITLTEGPRSSELSGTREKLYEMNTAAASFYHYLLTTHKVGKTALSYLEKRGVRKGTLETFKIGYAPSSGDALVRYLRKKGYSDDDLYESGLGTRRMRGMSDFFTERLMFPLIDHRDNIVGFSGRVLVSDSDGPKYINTKETPVYHKGQQFFGINIAKDAMRKEDAALLVEGEFDVISCFQEGISNAVAIKGTALTRDQVGLLSRYVKQVILGFDDDSAGQEALVRSLAFLEDADVTTTVVNIPGGKDPDEAIQHDPIAFKQALKHAVGVYDYLLEKKTTSLDMKSAASKKELGSFFLPLFAAIKNEIIKEHYLKKLSVLLDTSYESLVHEMSRHVTPRIEKSVKEVVKDKRPREEILEEYLLALLVQTGKRALMKQTGDNLKDVLPDERATEKVLRLLWQYVTDNDDIAEAKFQAFLPSELLPAYNAAMLYPLTVFPEGKSIEGDVKNVTAELVVLHAKKKMKELSLAIDDAESKGEEVGALQVEYSRVLALLKNE